MIPFDKWVPFIQSELPNCPRALMIDAIRQAAITFCQRSLFWRYVMDPLQTVAGVAIYELDFLPGTVVVSVRAMTYNGVGLKETSVDQLDNDEPNWRTREGNPQRYVFTDPNTIQLDRIPQDVVDLGATLALKPTQDALTCDESLFDEYRQAIRSGALTQLMMQPDKPWTNLQAASIYKADFDDLVIEANDRAVRGMGRRVRPRAKAHFF